MSTHASAVTAAGGFFCVFLETIEDVVCHNIYLLESIIFIDVNCLISLLQ